MNESLRVFVEAGTEFLTRKLINVGNVRWIVSRGLLSALVGSGSSTIPILILESLPG